MFPLTAGRREKRPELFRGLVRFGIAGAIVALAAACGGSKAGSVTSPVVGPVKTISLAPSAAPLVIGDTLRVIATLYDANANVVTTDTVAWKSANTTIATVSDSGTITAIAAGTTEVYATAKTITDSLKVTVSPPSTMALTGLTAVTAGFSHSCALGGGGALYCWGANAQGELGNDTTSISAFPVQVGTAPAFVSIAAGYSHTCGLTSVGQAYCWGDNTSGELGNATGGTTSFTPVGVAGGLVFAAISAGYSHTCGVTTGGAAYCWGADESGELGNGVIGTDSPTPSLVAGGLHFTSISAGGVFTCGITVDGTGYCWGANAYGALGNGGTSDSAVPVAIAGGLHIASISAGVSHACAVTTSGAAYCWGEGANGQLGTGLTSLNSAVPAAVAGGNTFRSITTGELSTCAIAVGGAAYCWGSGSFGALGTGSTNQADTPQPVTGNQTFVSLSGGLSFHVCGLTNAGTAYCWGYNNSGELGNANAGGYSVTPQLVVVPNPADSASTRRAR